MTKKILKKLLSKYPYLFFYAETMAILDRELNYGEDMDTDLVDCCLDTLEFLDNKRFIPYPINYSVVILSKIKQLIFSLLFSNILIN